MFRPTWKTHDKSSDAGRSHRRRGAESRAGSEHKKEKVYIQSRNVYENKQKDDNLSAPKGESFA
jgi:hypothetical protein